MNSWSRRLIYSIRIHKFEGFSNWFSMYRYSWKLCRAITPCYILLLLTSILCVTLIELNRTACVLYTDWNANGKPLSLMMSIIDRTCARIDYVESANAYWNNCYQSALDNLPCDSEQWNLTTLDVMEQECLHSWSNILRSSDSKSYRITIHLYCTFLLRVMHWTLLRLPEEMW